MYLIFLLIIVHNITQAYKLEVWPGFVTAVDIYEGGMLLQCDTVSRVLRTETVLDLLKSIHSKSGAANLKTESEKALLGQSVSCSVVRYTIIINA